MSDYLHGFDPKEQKRLMHQARFLEPYLYRGIDFKGRRKLLEVGCGVGAQTRILSERFKRLKIVGIDFSETQLEVAQKNLKRLVASGRVELYQQDAMNMTLKQKDFDCAFFCWFLEHVPDPLKVLKNARRHLKRGAVIYCTEVLNQTLFLSPPSPAFMQYWAEFNDFQEKSGGHPYLGAHLGNLLKAAGFRNIEVEMRPFHWDDRAPRERAAFTDYFHNILLSAEPNLRKTGRITDDLMKRIEAEVQAIKRGKNSLFFYSPVRAKAVV